MSTLALGIDAGTTAIKAAIFDIQRPERPLAIGRRRSTISQPRSGYSETDPERFLEDVAACMRDAVAQVDGACVQAIGISGTACGAWLAADGKAVRPAILWNDARAADIVGAWNADGRMREIFERSGNAPFPGYTLAVLRWLVENEPDSLDRATHLLFCKDWIRGWLTGCWASEATDASYAPFDIRMRRWDERLFEITGTASHADLLPAIQPDWTIDPLDAGVAAYLGLSAGIPVALGLTDIVAGCFGAGAIAPGYAVTILGTSANSSIVTGEPEFEPEGIGIMAAAPLGCWVRTMVNTSGSVTLDWAAALLTQSDVGALFALADEAETADLPVLLPYLSGAGVVSPFVDARARGAFLGLRSHHGPAEMARAAVEGLAFAVAECYASMPSEVKRITAIGGAARSDLLLQTIADAAGAEVLRPDGEEFGARGVALLAAVSAGLLAKGELGAMARCLDEQRLFGSRTSAVAERLERYHDLSRLVRESGRLW